MLTLVTSRAAWIWSAKQITAPSPRAAGAAAVRTALKRLRGPSGLRVVVRPLRAGEHRRLVRAQQQVGEIAALLHRVGAVGDHDARDLGARELLVDALG